MIGTAKPSSTRHAEPAPEKIARPGVTLHGAATGRQLPMIVDEVLARPRGTAAGVVQEARYAGRKR